MAATERMIKAEHDDAREIEQLSKKLKGVRETTLWGLVLELMQDDTEKHIKIVRFIRDRADEKAP